MSENICYTDAHARETDAVVLETDADAHAVLLDRTVFYPGGGVRALRAHMARATRELRAAPESSRRGL